MSIPTILGTSVARWKKISLMLSRKTVGIYPVEKLSGWVLSAVLDFETGHLMPGVWLKFSIDNICDIAAFAEELHY
jgi:hypothetical protein